MLLREPGVGILSLLEYIFTFCLEGPSDSRYAPASELDLINPYFGSVNLPGGDKCC